MLRTDYKDFVLDASMMGKQRFKITENPDGSVHIDDVSVYEVEGDIITASMLNGICLVANELYVEIGVSKRCAREATASAAAAAESEANAHADAERTQQNANTVATQTTEVANNTELVRSMKLDTEEAASAAADSEVKAEQYRDEAKMYADNAEAVVGIGTMTQERNGIGKPDGATTVVDPAGTFTAIDLNVEDETWHEIEAMLAITGTDMPITDETWEEIMRILFG